MSVITRAPSSTSMKPGGILFSLPRELRDEIYRHLVRGDHVVGVRPASRSGDRSGVGIHRPDLALLSVSKVVSVEVKKVLYSESIFRIYIQFDLNQNSLLSTLKPFEHMMNIDLDVSVKWGIVDEKLLLHYEILDSQIEAIRSCRQIWQAARDLGATLGFINVTNTLRSTLRIRWCICTRPTRATILRGREWSDADGAIPVHRFQWIKSLTRFRTVIFQVYVSVSSVSKAYDRDKTGGTVQHLTSKTEALKEYLEPGLGAGVIDHIHEHEHQQYTGTLTFHPHEYQSAILDGRAQVH